MISAAVQLNIIEVEELMRNYNPHETTDVITYPSQILSYSMLVNGV